MMRYKKLGYNFQGRGMKTNYLIGIVFLLAGSIFLLTHCNKEAPPPGSESTNSGGAPPISVMPPANNNTVQIQDIATHINAIDGDTAKLVEVGKIIKANLTDPISLAGQIAQIRPDSTKRTAQIMLIRLLAEDNIDSALQISDELPAGATRVQAYNAVFAAMPASDWLKNYSRFKRAGGLPEELKAALTGMRHRMESLSASESLEIARSFSHEDKAISVAAATHAGTLDSASSADILRLAKSMTKDIAQAYVGGALTGKLNLSAEAAAKFYESIPDDISLPRQPILDIAERWAQEDPRNALNWAGRLPSKTSTAQATASAMMTWLSHDSDAASVWAKNAPSEQKDTAVASVINYLLSKQDARGASEWVPLILDDSLRQSVAQMILNSPADSSR